MSPWPSVGTTVAVAVGGAAGGLLRMLMLAAWPLPAALLVINTIGSGLIGLVFAFSEPGRILRLPPRLSVGLMAGFCGALTTFSTLSVQALSLEAVSSMMYLSLSLLCWLLAAALGLAVGRSLNGPLERGRNGN